MSEWRPPFPDPRIIPDPTFPWPRRRKPEPERLDYLKIARLEFEIFGCLYTSQALEALGLSDSDAPEEVARRLRLVTPRDREEWRP